MTGPMIRYTDELHEALVDFDAARRSLFAAGVSVEAIEGFVAVVRRVDAETIAARHIHRNGEFYPYFPESYQAEEDGLEDAENLLRGPMPKIGEREYGL